MSYHGLGSYPYRAEVNFFLPPLLFSSWYRNRSRNSNVPPISNALAATVNRESLSAPQSTSMEASMLLLLLLLTCVLGGPMTLWFRAISHIYYSHLMTMTRVVLYLFFISLPSNSLDCCARLRLGLLIFCKITNRFIFYLLMQCTSILPHYSLLPFFHFISSHLKKNTSPAYPLLTFPTLYSQVFSSSKCKMVIFNLLLYVYMYVFCLLCSLLVISVLYSAVLFASSQ